LPGAEVTIVKKRTKPEPLIGLLKVDRYLIERGEPSLRKVTLLGDAAFVHPKTWRHSGHVRMLPRKCVFATKRAAMLALKPRRGFIVYHGSVRPGLSRGAEGEQHPLLFDRDGERVYGAFFTSKKAAALACLKEAKAELRKQETRAAQARKNVRRLQQTIGGA
jgi:hypothetical protein